MMNISLDDFCLMYKEQTGKNIDADTAVKFVYSKVEDINEFVSLYESRLQNFIEASDPGQDGYNDIITGYKNIIQKLPDSGSGDVHMFLVEQKEGFLQTFFDMTNRTLIVENFIKH